MIHNPKKRMIVVATRGVKEYRATIPTYVERDDVVLEVGCEWGTTTEIIALYAKEVIGIDVSMECIRRAREMRPKLRFEAIDAFDMAAILALDQPFDKVYLDLSGFSGYASLLDLIALVQMYQATLRPSVVVVKSQSLKQFIQRCVAWSGGEEMPERIVGGASSPMIYEA
jgi:precorrin-6B methylase 2